MLFLLFALFFVLWLILAVALFKKKIIINAAFQSGYRRALKDAVNRIEEIGSEFLYNEPLTSGALRASAAHELAMQVRHLSKRFPGGSDGR